MGFFRRALSTGLVAKVCTSFVVLACVSLFVTTAQAQSDATTVTWRAHPGDAHGFDVLALSEAVDRAATLGPLTSLLVARDTTTVSEVYFNGTSPTTAPT